jgi:transcription elongation factor Elf1
MKTLMVKRLESSFYAFRNTLSRMLDSYKQFIDMYEKGDVYISKKIDVYELLDEDDFESLTAMIDK